MKLIEQVRKARDGDPEAQAALYEAMYKRVYYLALRMTRSAEDAEDAVQEAFLSAFRALPNLADPNAFEGWLFQITANKCRNILGKAGRYAQLPEDEDGNTLLDELPEENEGLIPASALENQTHREIILSIIEALPQQQKECVLLFYYGELTVAQIAQVMDCSEGTVKSRLNYARKKLREGILETAHLTVAALGSAAGAAAAGSGTAAGSGAAAGAAAKTGLFAAVKAKVIAGVTAAALVAGGGAVILSQPKALSFTDPVMEANLRVLLDKPEGAALYPADVEDLYSLYLFEDGMALEESFQSGPVSQPEAGTAAAASLADLSQLPNLRNVYYASEDTRLLDTLGQMPELDSLLITGDGAALSDLSFLANLPGLRHFSAGLAGDADLTQLSRCNELRQLVLWSEGGISLPADGMDQLMELTLLANQNAAAPGAVCQVQLTQPLPQLRCLMLSGGRLPGLEFLTELPALQVLDLYVENLGSLDLTPMGSLEQLRAVNLTTTYDQTVDLSPLANCPALEVCLAFNGTVLNPPPQAVMDQEQGLAIYNQVSAQVQEEIFSQMEH